MDAEEAPAARHVAPERPPVPGRASGSPVVETKTTAAYQLQAAIASCHAAAPAAAETDWPSIAGLYEQLAAVQPSPVVALNHAVAVAMADGPAQGLARVEALVPQLTRYGPLHATRADLLRRLGRRAEAAESYRAALALAGTGAERRFLARRLAEVGGAQS
jgi:RNA polymerase sigma-70 factor, ECF subfamily